MNYVRKLGFEETPDYDFLRELFTKVLKTLGEPEDGVFDWMLLNGGKGWEASHVCRVLSLRLLSADYPSRLQLCWPPLTVVPPTLPTASIVGTESVLTGRPVMVSRMVPRRRHHWSWPQHLLM